MQRVIDIIARCYEYDVEVLSNQWTYILVVPVMLYLPFMLMKWVLLTCPVWLPITLICEAIRGRKRDEK